MTNQSITNAGPISNSESITNSKNDGSIQGRILYCTIFIPVSITQSSRKSGNSGAPTTINRHHPLPLARGISKDTILDEGDESQEALINEILG